MRELKGWQAWAIGGCLVILALFHLYTASFGIMQPRIQRGIHLLFLLPVAFLLFPATRRSPKHRPSVPDLFLAGLALLPPLYVIIHNDALSMRLVFIDPVLPLEMLLGIVNILLLLEGVRRAVVPAMAILIAVFFAYLYIAPYLPGVFYSKPPIIAEIIEMQYLVSNAGIYGSITGVSATFVALFVIFGAFMENTRTGQFFTDLACRLAGKSSGGPAKIAVISSGLFGSISGVGAANVYSTGTFTIPLMKSLGYRKQFAGAVEAAASTGGMLMPPVMGAGAFVMAEITGIGYVKIIIAAMLGSILYYASLVFRVHFTSLKENLRGVSEDQLLSYTQIIKDSYLLIPMVALVVLLLKGFSPFYAANAAIGITFLGSFLKKETRMHPAKLWATLRLSGQNMVMIALACAGAGMVVSIVTNTGLALGVASVITNWSGGTLLPALVLIMITSLFLGMGLPCTPAYIIAVTIGGPAMLAMGCAQLPSHLFVFYFAILAGITPPVCIPAYCAASIAGSKPLQTGFEAFKLALVGFLIPYIFIYNQALLMQGSLMEIITIVAVLLLAVFFMAGAMSGYLLHRMQAGTRVICLLCSFALAFVCTMEEFLQSPWVQITSLALILLLLLRWIWGRLGSAGSLMRAENK
ncbi:MAG: TRAP transporter fused permease subunit [Desulfohalobiaceae bacterium]|nr:TRAP transporter fused permease subunit [Desulfohalobiaceae bacterium]